MLSSWRVNSSPEKLHLNIKHLHKLLGFKMYIIWHIFQISSFRKDQLQYGLTCNQVSKHQLLEMDYDELPENSKCQNIRHTRLQGDVRKVGSGLMQKDLRSKERTFPDSKVELPVEVLTVHPSPTTLLKSALHPPIRWLARYACRQPVQRWLRASGEPFNQRLSTSESSTHMPVLTFFLLLLSYCHLQHLLVSNSFLHLSFIFPLIRLSYHLKNLRKTCIYNLFHKRPEHQGVQCFRNEPLPSSRQLYLRSHSCVQ